MSDTQGISSSKSSEHSILVVATGGSSGLGLRALVDFVEQSQENIVLVIGCRPPANLSVTETFSRMPRINKLDIVALDLVNSDSTRTFASHVLQTYSQQINVLLLCAAAVYGHYSVDESGNEKTLQTNVLSQALLIQCLWPRLTDPKLLNGMSPRIVFVGSSLHKGAAQEHRVSPSNLDNLLATTPWKPKQAYALSKLVQMHLYQITNDAFSKIKGVTTLPIAVAVCPGFVPQTGLIREYSWWIRGLMTYVMPLMPFTTSVEKAGETIIRAMKDQNLASGDCISPRGDDSLATECMDLVLRSAWRDWLISKGVWAEGL